LAAARHLTRVLLSSGMLFMLRAPHVGGPAMTIALPAGARTAALPSLVVVLALTGWGALQDNDHPHPHRIPRLPRLQRAMLSRARSTRSKPGSPDTQSDLE
jgi:hypothetical protein